MSGAELKVQTSGLAQTQAAIKRLMKFRYSNIPTVLKSIGQTVTTQTQDRIALIRRAPDGSQWQELSEAYERWKRKHSSGGLLMLRGHLRESIQYDVSGAEVRVGTNVVYAAAHQFGYKPSSIPARPYLGLSQGDHEEIGQVINDFVDRLLSKKGGVK